MGKGRGSGTDGGGGGGGGGSGSHRATPAPRLSTFLRTFGTTREARDGVDIDAEYVARRSILTKQQQQLSTGGGGGGMGTIGSGGGSGGGGGARRFHATASLARLICPAGDSSSSSSSTSTAAAAAAAAATPPKEVREALERFLQAVVRVLGGDTLLPDQLADASLLAFEAVSTLTRQGLAAAAKWAEEAEYGRDPDLAKKRGAAEERDFLKRKKAALVAAMGPVSDPHVGDFDAVAKELVRLQDKYNKPSSDAAAAALSSSGGGSGSGSESQQGAGAAAFEFGADIAFVPPGRTKSGDGGGGGGGGGFGGGGGGGQQQQPPPAGGSNGAAAKLAATMKAGLTAATATEAERRHAEAVAYSAGVSPLDAAGGAVHVSTCHSLTRLPAQLNRRLTNEV